MSNNQLYQQVKSRTDEQLVHMLQHTPTTLPCAFSELVHRHRSDIFRRCLSRLGNHDDADDAVQETLIRVYRGIANFRGDSALRTWLFSIADNQCNTLYISRTRHQLSDHLKCLIELNEKSRMTVTPTDEDGRMSLVRTALEGLPDPAREVLLMRFHLDLSLEEISGSLEVGLSAAKMRLYRAIKQLEKQCQGQVVLVA